MRKTVIHEYSPHSVTVKFINGRVKVAELTFGDKIDAEKVASIWETSQPQATQKSATMPDYKLF